jgi:hypothetical protein
LKKRQFEHAKKTFEEDDNEAPLDGQDSSKRLKIGEKEEKKIPVEQ